MISLKDLETKTFEKSVFGGYEMKAVDEFLTQVHQSYVEIQKDNDTLKSKLKIVISKVEEYKTVEESMRKALLSAQNIADEILRKAREQSEKIIKDANERVKKEIHNTKAEIKNEERKLEAVREKTLELTTKITTYYESEIESISRLAKGLGIDEKLAENIKENKEEIETEPFDMDTNTFDLTDELYNKTDELYNQIEETTHTKQKVLDENMEQMENLSFDNDNSNIETLLQMSRGLETKLIEVTIPAQTNKKRSKLFETSELQFGNDYVADKK